MELESVVYTRSPQPLLRGASILNREPHYARDAQKASQLFS